MLLSGLPKGLGTLDDLKKRSQKAFQRDQLWHSILQDAYEYLLPQRDLFNDKHEGQRKRTRTFDSTATNAIKEAANKVQSTTAPIWSKWAEIEPGEEIIEALEQAGDQAGVSEEEVREDLQRVGDIVFDHINRSNFATQFNEMVLDWLVGTGTLRVDEGRGDKVVTFSSVPQNTVAFEEGPEGTVETHWRKLKVPCSHLTRLWKGFKPSEQMNKRIEKDPMEMVSVTEGVVYEPKEDKYYGVVWADDEERVSWAFDFDTFNPWVTGRYAKTAGEIRGRGPGIDTLPDVKTLNKVKEFTLKKAAIDVAGMFTATDDGVTNPYNISIGPGVVIPVGSNNTSNPSIARLDTNTNLNLAVFEIEKLEANIKRAFFNDLRDPNGPVRSATEIALEARELAQRIGSAFGRIQTEVLMPVLERVVDILKRRGLIEIPKIDGRELKIKFTSPLARAKDLEELTSVQTAMELTLALAGPEIMNLGFKTEDFPKFAAEKLGMPMELLRTPEEKAQVASKATEMQQQQLQQGVQPSA